LAFGRGEGAVSKKKIIWVVVALIVGVGVAGGMLAWRFGGPHGPARKLVGVWGVVQSGDTLGEAVKGAIERKDPGLAEAAGDELRSAERVRFDRSGAFRYSQDFAGMTIAEEGTWQAAEREDGKLLVKIHKARLSLRNPQKGETKEDAQDAVIEWVVSVVDPDQLSVTMTDGDGKGRSFGLRRARD
jgi:hypothetical protein